MNELIVPSPYNWGPGFYASPMGPRDYVDMVMCELYLTPLEPHQVDMWVVCL